MARRACHARGQPRFSRDRGQGALVRLPKHLDPGGRGHDHVGPEVVVQIRRSHAVEPWPGKCQHGWPAVARQPDGSGPRRAGRRGRGRRIDRKCQLFVGRSRPRLGVPERNEPDQRLADRVLGRRQRGEGRPVLRFANEHVLQEDDRRRRARRAGARGGTDGREALPRARGPALRTPVECPEHLLQRGAVAAAGGEARELELRGEVARSTGEGVEQALRLRLIRVAAQALELLRERVGGPEIGGVECERAPPMRDRLLDVAIPALGQRTEPFDRRIARRQLGRPAEPLDGLGELLLPEEEQPEIRPTRRLVGHELHETIELLPGVQILTRLHGGERHVERGDRLAVGCIGHARRAAAAGARY